VARSALALAYAADAKHLQIYFTDASAQAAVAGLGWSGSLTPPANTSDILAISNAMNLPSKANVGVRKTIDYAVRLTADGSAETTLVLDFSSTAPFDVPPFQSGVFRDYLRVYRVPGTVPQAAPGEPPVSGDVPVETGLPVIVRTFRLPRESEHRETILSTVPAAWTIRPNAGPVTVAHYRLFVVRQADLEDVPTTVAVTPPPGWRVRNVSAWRNASGEALAVSAAGGTARLSAPLDGDIVMDVGIVRR
jgi:hypothetical protein